MTAEEEQRIRERAYFIWEQEGRPHGRELDHRLRAESEIAAERSRAGDTPRQHRYNGHDGERLSSARQAAEALFTPNPIEQSKANDAAPTGAAVRKPRVLPILPKEAAHQEEEAARPSKQQVTPKIARSRFARIRTLVRYGMTARQVAEVYGVDVDEIERILHIA